MIDTSTAFSEDLLIELRVGNILFRFIGPTIRSTFVRVNAENEKDCGENELISTLSKFRAFPGFGVAFGKLRVGLKILKLALVGVYPTTYIVL